MSRYVFSNDEAQDCKALSAARKAARSHGATVVKSLAGTMLLEVEAAQVPSVAEALPGWQYCLDRSVTRIPEQTPLQRARLRARLSVAGKP